MKETYVIQGAKSCPRIDKSNVHHYVFLMVASLTLVASFIVNGVIGNGIGAKSNAKDVSDNFHLVITPSGWTFSIFGVIYAWQAVWVVYAWTLICRPSAPPTICWVVYVLFAIGNVANIIWVFVWGDLHPHVAFVFNFILASCLIACVGVECAHLSHHATLLHSQHQYKRDLWLTRILVLNGLAVYATWQNLSTITNFGIILQYYAGVSDTLTGTLTLSFITANILAYFILENTLFDRYTRNVYLVYPVIIWTLSGSLDAQFGVEGDNSNFIFTVALLVIAVILFINRIIVLIVFTCCTQGSLLELIISLFVSPPVKDKDTATRHQPQSSA